MSKIFLRYAQNNTKYSVQRVAFLRGAQCQKKILRYAQNNAKYSVHRVAFLRGAQCQKNFLRYAQNNAKYSVQRVAFLKGTQCQKCSFAARQIMKNWCLVGYPLGPNGKCSARGVSVCESEREGTGEGEGMFLRAARIFFQPSRVSFRSKREILDSYFDRCLILHVCLFIHTCSLRAISSLRALCLHDSYR